MELNAFDRVFGTFQNGNAALSPFGIQECDRKSAPNLAATNFARTFDNLSGNKVTIDKVHVRIGVPINSLNAGSAAWIPGIVNDDDEGSVWNVRQNLFDIAPDAFCRMFGVDEDEVEGLVCVPYFRKDLWNQLA